MHEVLDLCACRCPNVVSRAEDHIGRKNWIDLERREDCCTASRLLRSVGARRTLDREQDSFCPRAIIEHIRSQSFARRWVDDRLEHHTLDLMRGVPFLKLLVLEGVTRRIA